MKDFLSERDQFITENNLQSKLDAMWKPYSEHFINAKTLKMKKKVGGYYFP